MLSDVGWITGVDYCRSEWIDGAYAYAAQYPTEVEFGCFDGCLPSDW